MKQSSQTRVKKGELIKAGRLSTRMNALFIEKTFEREVLLFIMIQCITSDKYG